MPRYDAIIIGGGHNGLVAAAYLARAGRNTLVLERRELLGGCAVTEELWPGYRVSTGAYLNSLLQARIVRELELERFGYRVDAKDPAFFSAFPDGRHFFMWQDPARTLAEIARFSEHDARVFPAYEARLERLSQIVESLLLTTPPQFPPRGPLDLLDYLKFAGRLRGLNPQEMASPGEDLHAKRGRIFGRVVRIRTSESDARHRRRDRRERRPAFARHGLHSAAPLHGRRGRASRLVGFRARRDGRGLRSHCRFGARFRREHPHGRRGSQCACARRARPRRGARKRRGD